MSVLRDSGCNVPSTIVRNFYPFYDPQNIEGMIIGNDIDSLLSASFLKTKFGWDIVGVYDYKTLSFSATVGDFHNKLLEGKYIAVDLDIYHPCIFSIGHHIIGSSCQDCLEGHSNSLNPNLLRGIYLQSYRRKYPLNTIHFLLWLFESESGMDTKTRSLVWLADSSYVNGQRHRFRSNVHEWVMNFFRSPAFLDSFELIDTYKFEYLLSEWLFPLLKGTGLNTSRGQVSSYHMGLSGYQCQWTSTENERACIIAMFELIEHITGWEIPVLPRKFIDIKGVRRSLFLSDIFKDSTNLDSFLLKNNVFSFVFTTSKTINYTTGIKL
ncbi:hypothetical protein [Methanohalophilus halophilus]|uniref:Uncharacterized protein n=1 Tax=Methanohalophilus halophilus TaxID=2177 RepID=A0A1L3Q399_9EURY|nr:hypothetical protein [Methanohalophilus halophilus]APH39313.1 hypothetical protein BHR79_07345 [Methanohalophilus halophilus]RNI09620.1 hypothetical protein EFE40_02890 [Methanohalophilus halophilus]SDW49896.1 hypothetical protein SAMN04515625_1042 [Methanohalophilus halophilus]